MLLSIFRRSLKLQQFWRPLGIGFIIGVVLELLMHSPRSQQLKSEGLLLKEILVKHHSPDEDLHLLGDWEGSELNGRVSVHCIVQCTSTSFQNQIKNIKAVMDTWGRRCTNLTFVSNFKKLMEVNHTRFIQFPNLNKNMTTRWGRTRAVLDYIYETHGHEVDWFLRADDTQFVLMENLRRLLEPRQSSEPLQFGFRMKGHLKPGYMSRAAGSVLSRKALELLVTEGLRSDIGSNCSQDRSGVEDVELGRCLINVGVSLEDSRDEHERHRFLPYSPEYHLAPTLDQKKETFQKISYYSLPFGLDSCSDSAIAFHDFSFQGMYVMEFLLYHVRPHGVSQNIHVHSSKTYNASSH